MNIKINNPKGIDGQKLYLMVHCGYDFDPTILAVCSSSKKATEMLKEHYENKENEDHPWNGVTLIEAIIDDWIDYKDIDNIKGNLTALAMQALGT